MWMRFQVRLQALFRADQAHAAGPPPQISDWASTSGPSPPPLSSGRRRRQRSSPGPDSESDGDDRFAWSMLWRFRRAGLVQRGCRGLTVMSSSRPAVLTMGALGFRHQCEPERRASHRQPDTPPTTPSTLAAVQDLHQPDRYAPLPPGALLQPDQVRHHEKIPNRRRSCRLLRFPQATFNAAAQGRA